MDKEVSDYIQNVQNEHREILNSLRELILTITPNVKEQYKWSRPVYAVEKDFCYLQASKKHVTLGFFDFDKVMTHKEKIEGTGKSMRHIKIKNMLEFKQLNIRKMLIEILE